MKNPTMRALWLLCMHRFILTIKTEYEEYIPVSKVQQELLKGNAMRQLAKQYRFPILDKSCRWSKNSHIQRDKILVLFDSGNAAILDAIDKHFDVLTKYFAFGFASLASVQRSCPNLFAEFEFIMHPSPHKFFNVWSNLLSFHRTKGFFISDLQSADVYQQWTNKDGWTNWMHTNGLQNMLPKIYAKDVAFPCYVEFKGVGLSYGMEARTLKEFSDLISSFPKNTSYTVRELVNGLGTTEGVMYGSAYKGKLLSLRCAVMDKQVGKKASKSGVLQSSYLTPCSSTVVSMVGKIHRKAAYSGVFQGRYNLNPQFEVRLIDMSSALGKLPTVFEGLFEQVLLPLFHTGHFPRNDSNPLNQSVVLKMRTVSMSEKALVDNGGGFPTNAKILQLARYVNPEDS